MPAPAVTVREDDLPRHVSPHQHRRRDTQRSDSDIFSYWRRIKGNREMPPWRDLDANQIAFFWPNSFLLSCQPGGGRAPAIAGATRITDTDDQADRAADIAVTSAMIEWVVSLSTQVAQQARPLRNTQDFPGATGATMRCEVIAMPLGENGRTVESVLCHLKLR